MKTVADYRDENAFTEAWHEGRIERQNLLYNRALKTRAENFPAIYSGSSNYLDAFHTLFTGEKFAGGWGLDKNFEIIDLEKVRTRSVELWRSNPIANAIFGRMETKMINDGLRVEALPEGRFIGYEDTSEFLQSWAESSEALYNIYAVDPMLVDERQRLNLYQLQRQGYLGAKVSGDILQIRRIDPITMLPRVQLVDGKHIITPFEFLNGINPKTGRDVIHGVEIDKAGREVGYWVKTRAFNPNYNNIYNNGVIFIPAYGPNSGRRVANLVYGSRLRIDEYRGVPILGQCMQMLKQVDRTLDHNQLAMALDSSLVLSVVTDAAAPRSAAGALGSGPLKKSAIYEKTASVTQDDGSVKTVDFKSFGPGIIVDNLRPGQKIESHNMRHPNPDLNKSVLFAINVVSASVDLPPEIVLLMFNNNFSASRQAVNELDATRRKEHSQFNPQFNDPIYRDFIIGLELSNRLNSPGLIDAIRSGDQMFVNAWLQAQWSSTAELSVDMLKHINSFEKAFDNGLIDRTSVSLKFFGKRHEKVVARLAKENLALAKAREPLVALEKQQGG